MATLLLTTLGTALGGPIGGALGSIVGQSIDQNLFGPPARRGPRLNNLSVQTSSYGTPIARIYGRMRVAGTVVWATDLREAEVVSGGGKGSPGAITYAYSASFAVALSSRAAQSIGRIWADGKLLRGSDGLFKTKVKHRFYTGSEAQPVDPLIAATEGVGGSPAFRGIALAVFEDLALADYGNRIPSLTFELVADSAPPRVAVVISDISGGVIEEASDAAALVGFAALGNDRRSAVEPLVDLWGGIYHDDGSKLRATAASGVAVTIGEPRRAGCIVEGDRPAPRIEREQEAADALPTVLTIEYHDPQRDFQAGQMRASLAAGGRSQRRIDSAAALNADTAKSLASDALAGRWAGRDRVTVRLAPAYLGLRPGQLVDIVGVAGLYRIESVTLDGLVVVIEARRVPQGKSVLIGDAGRGTLDPDLATGQSRPILIDLPAIGVDTADQFGVTLAVGSNKRFRPTAMVVEANGQPLASLRVDRAAITGVATSLLSAGPTTLIDRVNSVDVLLSNAAALLYHADQDALAWARTRCSSGASWSSSGARLRSAGAAIVCPSWCGGGAGASGR
ncbi:MAG: phage tail protein [Sphingomonas bacterium]|nr:phage tail protein [Sphingomonas bacterium]